MQQGMASTGKLVPTCMYFPWDKLPLKHDHADLMVPLLLPETAMAHGTSEWSFPLPAYLMQVTWLMGDRHAILMLLLAESGGDQGPG